MGAGGRRFRVVYRLVGQVYVMAVAPGAMNVFFSTQLVNAAVHRLCALSRGGGAALNQERLTSRFPEVRLESDAACRPSCAAVSSGARGDRCSTVGRQHCNHRLTACQRQAVMDRLSAWSGVGHAARCKQRICREARLSNASPLRSPWYQADTSSLRGRWFLSTFAAVHA